MGDVKEEKKQNKKTQPRNIGKPTPVKNVYGGRKKLRNSKIKKQSNSKISQLRPE